MQESFTKIQEFIMIYGLQVLAAILIFMIGKWVAHFIADLIEKIMLKTHIEKTISSFVKNLSYFVMLAFVIIAALNKVGVETTSLIAVVGAAGLAVGLALQGSLSNFAAGVMLIIFKPFKVSDLVEAGGQIGTIEEIQIFNTIMSTPDNKKVIIPNAKITSDCVVNYSCVDKRRVDLIFSISYSDNMKDAKDALMKVITSDPRVLKDPAPLVAVSELGDSSVNLVCRPWCSPTDYWGVYFDTVEKGKLELEKAGITIPFPQRDIHIYEEKKA